MKQCAWFFWTSPPLLRAALKFKGIASFRSLCVPHCPPLISSMPVSSRYKKDPKHGAFKYKSKNTNSFMLTTVLQKFSFRVCSYAPGECICDLLSQLPLLLSQGCSCMRSVCFPHGFSKIQNLIAPYLSPLYISYGLVAFTPHRLCDKQCP